MSHGVISYLSSVCSLSSTTSSYILNNERADNMRNISEMNIIQIEATNLCNKSCSNCTRFCGHYTRDKIFFVSLEDLERYLYSLRDYYGVVGLIGGEPTLHPQFIEISYLFKKYRPKTHCGLWSNTSTAEFKNNIYLINEVYGHQNLNDHSTAILHTPLLVSADSLSDNQHVKNSMFNQCWVQLSWSATITPKGGYFCEVAGMLAYLFNGPDGWDVKKTPDWWKLGIEEYKYQIDWACNKCGAAFPCKPRRSADCFDDVSMDNLERLIKINSPKVMNGKFRIYSEGLIFGQNRAIDWYWNK